MKLINRILDFIDVRNWHYRLWQMASRHCCQHTLWMCENDRTWNWFNYFHLHNVQCTIARSQNVFDIRTSSKYLTKQLKLFQILKWNMVIACLNIIQGVFAFQITNPNCITVVKILLHILCEKCFFPWLSFHFIRTKRRQWWWSVFSIFILFAFCAWLFFGLFV